jgi:hypothetical protein
MPTILDLLGYEYSTEHAGSSIFNNNSHSPNLLYSQTRKANVPANLCAVIDDNKFMIDRVMGHYLKMSIDEKNVRSLSSSEQDYYQTLLFWMAEERGLLEK